MTLRAFLPGLATLAVAALALAGVALTSDSATDGAAPVVESPHGSTFRENCAVCHRPDSWTPARISDKFDHRKYGFALTGAHKDAPCLQCHENLEFTTAKGSRCADCHQDVHLGEMGPDCARCHSTRDFVDRSESTKMHRSTRFPLTGAHLTTDCAGCHVPNGTASMSFLNTPTTCDGCHLQEYRATSSPDHQAAGFPTDCARCHSTNVWSAGTFDHSTTGFPLTGAHRPLACQQCHAGNTFTPLDPACVSCHRADYDATSDPNHASVGFPPDCARCHGTGGWSGANFDHAVTGFALTGAHTTQTCQACHGAGPFTPLDPACVACHRAQYDATTNPNHAAAGFSTDCASCHGTTQWAGATFDHDARYFPIYSGRHLGKWSACVDCHVNQQSYAVFECILCHEHSNRADLDSKHSGVSGYEYLSARCYACHPQGRR